MLSKVLKGDSAREVSAMVFPAAEAAGQLRSGVPSTHPSGDEDQSILLGKIRNLEAGLTTVKKESFEAGRKQGERDARAELTPVLDRMHASIAGIVSLRPELRRRAEKDAVDLSLQIARRVLHRELSIDSNALNVLAKVVFDRLTRTESWQLTLHPRFAEAVRGALPAAGVNSVRIEADPSCAPGTFVVRCHEGKIDASVETQLDEISHGLTDRLARK